MLEYHMNIKMLWSAALVMSGLTAVALAQTAGSNSTKDDDKPQPSSTSSAEKDSSQSDEERSNRSETRRRSTSSDDDATSERSGSNRSANRRESSERGWRDRSSSSDRSQYRSNRDSSEDNADSDAEQSRWRRDRDRSDNEGRFSERRREERGNSDRERRQLGIVLSSGNDGLTVDTVRAEGAAARVGLRVGDEIITVGGRTVNSPSQFTRLILNVVNSNQRLPITVWRDGRQRTIYWTNDDRFGRDGSTFAQRDNRNVRQYDESQESEESDNKAFLGVVFDTRYDNAVVVRQVYPNSPAQRAGVRPGDTILSINGDKVSSPDDVTEIVSDLEPGEEIELQVSHAPPRTLELQLSARRQPAYTAYRGETLGRDRSSYDDDEDRSSSDDNDEGDDDETESDD
jgi:hypothetical protein